MRIQKYLSQQNILSRRKAEEYLKKGWIKVNGEIVSELGLQIDPDKDHISFVPEAIQQKDQTITIAFHKPVGIVSNCPEPGQKQITDLLPEEYKDLHTIGRLDKDSEGLILLTNDGVLAKKLLSTEHIREYSVRVDKPITEDMVARLQKGIRILGEYTLPADVEVLSPLNFIIRLREGKNRQIRRMSEAVGLRVVYLKRFCYGDIKLGDLKKGEYRLLSEEEKKKLA